MRFVILHHQLSESEHWDLMLEKDEVLLTWQLFVDPLTCGFPIPARRISDHRKAYLEYEGPLSGGRGTVRRSDFGAVILEELTGSICRMILAGQKLQGRFCLEQDKGATWVLRHHENQVDSRVI